MNAVRVCNGYGVTHWGMEIFSLLARFHSKERRDGEKPSLRVKRDRGFPWLRRYSKLAWEWRVWQKRM